MEKTTFDLVVIGGGSGGIATARRAAGHGARVALVEAALLGGTCVNVGCVPKKVMWHAAELAQAFREAPEYGFGAPPPPLDWAALVDRREAYLRRLNGIYARNLDRDGVTWIHARAELLDGHRVRAGDRILTARHIVIATGGSPRRPELPGSALGIDSDGFFALQACPKRVAIAGSGYIAVELAGVLQALGAQVTLLLRTRYALRAFEPMLGETLLEQMADEGVAVRTETVVSALEETGDGGVCAVYADGGRAAFDHLIWATGRGPNTGGLGLERAGVEVDAGGYVAVDDYQNTSASGVYAVGDVTGRVELTPVAIAAGRRLADRLFGDAADRHLDYQNIPAVVFSHPPIGSVGLSEPEARERFGDAVRVYESRFVNLYYGVLKYKPVSRMKMVCVGARERIVGLHVIGRGADEMLQGFAVALRMGASKSDFDDTVAIHPTSAEEMVTMAP